MNIKNILTFIVGLTIGGTSGVLGTRKYFQDKYQKIYENDHRQLEEYYHRTDEYKRRSDSEDDEEEYEDDGINSPNEIPSRPGGRMSAEERAERKKLLNKNWEGTTNYAKMYQEKNNSTESKLSEEGSPSEGDQNKEDEYVDDTTQEEEAFDDHRQNMNKPPKIISAEAYSELPAHIEKEVLYFYAYDETLCDENDEEPIEEPERLVGDALYKYGFVDSDERIIFVMNYAMDVCYEIQKIDASWTETH